ncbi:hypothetical protein KY284_034436 [Solanum tuberosum]|nr:hypothetical protein KY284_034436 [Solanum tuberosum]
MADDENVENMFSRFSKIVCELKSLGMVYSNGLHIRKLIRSLPKAWETKAAILEDGDLQLMTYDELRGNLMAYEQNHINRYNKDEKKKTVAFNVEVYEVEEEVDEASSEGMAFITRGVRQMLRQRKQRPQQESRNNSYSRNDDRCYHCGKPGHIRQNCPEIKRKNYRRNDNPKSLGAWNEEDVYEEDPSESANICFMALEETNQQNKNDASEEDSSESTDVCFMALGETSKVIDEYNKLANEKKNWQISLEVSQVEVDLLLEELGELKTQLNSVKKSPSHSPVRSNRSFQNLSQNSSFYSAKSSFKPSCYTCGKIGHKSFNCKAHSSSKWVWRPKNVNSNPPGPNQTWERTKRTYKKGMWVIDSGCSRHMNGKKENFNKVEKIDGGYVRFGDNAKGEVTRIGTITISPSCDLVEVYLVDGLKHNLLSISQLCDVGFDV